jgi:DNA polymerase-1
VTLLYPSVQGVSQLKRYTPDAVVEKYGLPPRTTPTSPRSSARRATTCRGAQGGREDRRQVAHAVGSLDALLENADKITGVVGGNLRDHLDDVRRNRT